ncbi:MAG: hypothetical protein HOP12_12015 [Candidatus Eisenbacteria bacterium]|uniref:Uncharacterized protein n=1 Tax=Eiseniibacteriota bacterium TaxID=2212470 RepID=A0A849SU15_UNCEI|nr:hypothetical protein [Candidatus Eisenbacteria bacterium]
MGNSMRMKCLAALLAAGLMTFTGCASDDDSPLAPAGPVGPAVLVVYGSNRPPTDPLGQDLFVKDLSSSEPAWRVPNVNTISVDGPCGLSADGRLLAFFTFRFFTGSIGTIGLYDVETGSIRLPVQVSSLFNAQNPALSGDGHYLAVQEQVGGPFEQQIVLEDLTADTLVILPSINEDLVANFDPSLNGDGSLIAFGSNGSRSIGNFDILLYSVPGDTFVALPGLNSTLNDLAPSLSEDGRYLVFQSGRLGGSGIIDIYLYDRVTSSLVPLPGLNTVLSEITPAISPDGRYIAFTTESEGGDDIGFYDVVEQKRLTVEGVNDPLWAEAQATLSRRPARIAK